MAIYRLQMISQPEELGKLKVDAREAGLLDGKVSGFVNIDDILSRFRHRFTEYGGCIYAGGFR